jgi:multiple sugar transport system ATP-binding protein
VYGDGEHFLGRGQKQPDFKQGNDQAELGTKMGKGEPQRYRGAQADAKLSGKSCEFLRIFPRCFTILRTDQGRGYAILRIFTGMNLFYEESTTGPPRSTRIDARHAGVGVEKSSMAQVVIEKLGKTFKGPKGESIRAVSNLSLSVESGEFFVLVGPSGCGKSTTLRLIAGLEEIDQGTISIEGRVINDVAPKDRDIAMVFQNHALYPHMTVFENMAFGLKLRKCSRAEIEERVGEAAEILGLKDCLGRKPEALSGGQRQRVAVGRAIVRKPKVFLFDEPLSNLDARMRAQMRQEISKLHARLGSTMIYVTHDQVEAMSMGDRIAVMKEGVVQQAAAPMEVYRRPANMFVAGFIGSPPMNFIRGTLVNDGNGLFFQEESEPGAANGFRLRVAVEVTKGLAGHGGKEVVLGIRPENIAEKSSGAANGEMVEAMVEAVEPMGPETYLYAKAGAHSLVARVSADCRVEGGRKVPLVFDMSKAHFFDPATEKVMVGK